MDREGEGKHLVYRQIVAENLKLLFKVVPPVVTQTLWLPYNNNSLVVLSTFALISYNTVILSLPLGHYNGINF